MCWSVKDYASIKVNCRDANTETSTSVPGSFNEFHEYNLKVNNYDFHHTHTHTHPAAYLYFLCIPLFLFLLPFWVGGGIVAVVISQQFSFLFSIHRNEDNDDNEEECRMEQT